MSRINKVSRQDRLSAPKCCTRGFAASTSSQVPIGLSRKGSLKTLSLQLSKSTLNMIQCHDNIIMPGRRGDLIQNDPLTWRKIQSTSIIPFAFPARGLPSELVARRAHLTQTQLGEISASTGLCPPRILGAALTVVCAILLLFSAKGEIGSMWVACLPTAS